MKNFGSVFNTCSTWRVTKKTLNKLLLSTESTAKKNVQSTSPQSCSIHLQEGSLKNTTGVSIILNIMESHNLWIGTYVLVVLISFMVLKWKWWKLLTQKGKLTINTYNYCTFYHGYVPPQEVINFRPRWKGYPFLRMWNNICKLHRTLNKI